MGTVLLIGVGIYAAMAVLRAQKLNRMYRSAESEINLLDRRLEEATTLAFRRTIDLETVTESLDDLVKQIESGEVAEDVLQNAHNILGGLYSAELCATTNKCSGCHDCHGCEGR